MNKQRILIYCVTVFLASILPNGRSASATDNVRPNFVWLISEDNSKHYLKMFDEHGAATPHIKALAKSGLIFRYAFSNSPVCSVARTTLLTGCYAPRIGTQFHRRSKKVPMPAGVKPFPQYLCEAGYYTTNRRKTDYNVIAGREVWNQSSNNASWRNRQQGQQFFHQQTFTTTHEGSLHFSKAVMENEPTRTDPEKVFVPPYFPDTKIFRYTIARYHDRIRLVDRQIGKVIEQLKEDGLFNSTFIFYFGDHGGVLPRSKGYAYESGLHIPLVVHIPQKFQHLVDAKPGTTIDGFVSFIDFGPTLLNLAGIEIPKGIDGKPFLGIQTELAKLNQRDETYGYADRFDEKYDLVRTVRKGRFKYIRNYQPFNFDALQNNYRYKMLAYREWRQLFETGKLNAVHSRFFRSRQAEELYDLTTDPHETQNLASNPKYAKTVLELRQKLSAHIKATLDLSMFPESLLFEKAFDNPTRFGKNRKNEISELVDIADLSLSRFASVRDELHRALHSEKPWHRYWALIACSCHGKLASEFYTAAEKIAVADPNRLVRVRAAEFLALAGHIDPAKTILTGLNETRSGVKATLILNSLVMLRDGSQKFQFHLRKSELHESVLQDQNVKRRLLYLTEFK